MNDLSICNNLPPMVHDDGTRSFYCYVAIHETAIKKIGELMRAGGGVMELRVSNEGFLYVLPVCIFPKLEIKSDSIMNGCPLMGKIFNP
jgi:hypothetical protein